MNKKFLLTISIAVLMISVLLIFNELSHTFPDMTGEEFHEQFDDHPLIKHFKSKYPKHFVGVGSNSATIMLAWGYGAILDSGNIAELRVQENFGKYEFTYYCGPVSGGFQSVNIKNPTIDDIDNNLC